jgi:hypothetical protein
LASVFGAFVACLLIASPGLAATSGTWTPTGPMEIGRAYFTADLLRNGDVLVAGGYDGTRPNVIFDSVEIYHTATGTWSPAANMNEFRAAAVSVRLPSGRVMVMGGDGLTGTLASAEIYDPRTNTWTETAPMLSARSEDFLAAVSRTAHPKVLVAGGFGADGNPTASAELYDVRSDTWTAVASMNEARGEYDWVRLKSGKFLVAGGCCTSDGNPISSAEIFDPVADTWTLTGALNVARFDPSLVMLRTGKVLAAAGGTIVDGQPSYTTDAELWEPNTGVWTVTADMTSPHQESEYASMLLSNGKVLITGGRIAPDTPVAATDLYDPSTHTWSSGGDMSVVRAGHSAVTLRDGRVLVMGGLSPDPAATASVDIYTP